VRGARRGLLLNATSFILLSDPQSARRVDVWGFCVTDPKSRVDNVAEEELEAPLSPGSSLPNVVRSLLLGTGKAAGCSGVFCSRGGYRIFLL